MEESITFSDEWFEATFDEYFTVRYRWTSITSFKEKKRYLAFTLAGIEYMLPKKHFISANCHCSLVATCGCWLQVGLRAATRLWER